MRWAKKIFQEIFGLFVDDGSFAVAILIWICVGKLILSRIVLNSAWSGLILFAGLALILLSSTLLYTKRRR